MNDKARKPDEKAPKYDYAPSIQALKARTSGVPKSERRRGFWKGEAMLPVLTGLGLCVLWSFWKTCRIRHVTGAEHLEPFRNRGEPVIFCHWHQMHLFCSRYLLNQIAHGLQLAYLISPSHSGDVVARIMESQGATALRGSDTRTGGKALQQLYGVVRKEHRSPVITLDGPRGPAHYCKPGAIMLARLTRAPLVPISYAAARSRRLNTWDRFVMPWPFTRISIAIGKPIEVAKDASPEDFSHYQTRLSEALFELEKTAAKALR